MSATSEKSNLPWYILGSLILGAVAGSAVEAQYGDAPPTWLTGLNKNVMGPLGQVFLNMLFLTVVPLVFSSLALGVVRLGDLSKLGRIGLKSFGFFLVTMTTAVTIGLILVNTVGPGRGFPAEDRDSLVEKSQKEQGEKLKQVQESEGFSFDKFIAMLVPRNPINAAAEGQMLGIIFLALLTGAALIRMPPDKSKAAIDVLETVGEVTIFIIGLAMRIAPFGVFALIFEKTSQSGLSLLQYLGAYAGVVVVGLLIQAVLVLPVLLRVMGGVNPLWFFGRVRSVVITAFSTSSSNATLPTSIRTATDRLNVPRPIASSVLPLGATMNMNGTALFEGVTVVFLCQVFGLDLSIGTQIAVVCLCVLTAVGAAGVPGGSIPLLAMVLGVAGLPADQALQGVALILGIDRILDMCRTTLNVLGDLCATVFVARSEGHKLQEDPPAVPPKDKVVAEAPPANTA